MSLIRSLWYDIASPAGRYGYIEAMLREVPGTFGAVLRAKVLKHWFRSAGPGLLVFQGARILGPGLLTVGRDCRIGINNVIQANGEVTLGDEVILGPGVKIWSVNHRFQILDEPIWEQGYEHKPVVIGKGTWIGADSFIMPGAALGEGCVVSAGSVVGGKAVAPFSILAGNPARTIGTRQDRALPPSAVPSTA